MDELQRIGGVPARSKKGINTGEGGDYRRALKRAADLLRQPSSSAPRSAGAPSTQLDQRRWTLADRKECKSSGTPARQDKGKREKSSKKKQNDSAAEVSKAALGSPPAGDSGGLPTTSNVQKNKRPLDKRQAKPPRAEEPNDESPADEQKSQSIISTSKLKGRIHTFWGLNSLTKSQKKGLKKETNERPVQRRVHLPSKRLRETDADLQAKSSKTDKVKRNGHSAHRNLKRDMPDFEEEKGLCSSELSMEISSPECAAGRARSPPQDDTEEDVQFPVVVLQKEPAEITPGSFVWCKFKRYPYWPSLVKLVDSRQKKLTIVFLEEAISDPTKKKKSFKVPLRSVKHYDCPEKQQLLENARKDYGRSIDWCDSLIFDYRIRLGCGSFSGSFMDYCTAAISLPVRRELQGGKREVLFPAVGSGVTEDEQEVITIKPQRNRKLLPDRARAARDRANEKLVDFIVHSKEAENHLLDILAGKRTSRWLKKFQSSNQRINCLETYIEDEEQMELVVAYLQTVCQRMSSATKKLMLGDQTKFIFDVLIPEAVIFAIAATEQTSYEEAEAKFLKGPSITKRERRSFEEQILEKKRLKLSEAKIKREARK
ncbi:PWWP domain-containing DNA repair factor 3A isoform X1 [Eleutherodactylus coqui]|uniref:PWWP domain-containing DNA repair factor 3A isoform X1 n=1 Tax=Eleutherodactylus coqui TaxID=57060 RepID=UPI0034621BBF